MRTPQIKPYRNNTPLRLCMERGEIIRQQRSLCRLHYTRLKSGESGAPGASGGGVAHRGGLLDADADGAAHGVFDCLFGLVGEVVVQETVNEEQSGYGERASLSTGADTKSNTWGSGSLEVGGLRPLEDGSERGGALDSDGIVPETARDGWEQARVNGR